MATAVAAAGDGRRGRAVPLLMVRRMDKLAIVSWAGAGVSVVSGKSLARSVASGTQPVEAKGGVLVLVLVQLLVLVVRCLAIDVARSFPLSRESCLSLFLLVPEPFIARIPDLGSDLETAGVNFIARNRRAGASGSAGGTRVDVYL